jgi:pyridoxine/pyridoxamine 5'-phosphate oxidase
VNELFFNEPFSTRPLEWRVSTLVTKQEKKISEKQREEKKRLKIHNSFKNTIATIDKVNGKN